jgi:hypothetical protein
MPQLSSLRSAISDRSFRFATLDAGVAPHAWRAFALTAALVVALGHAVPARADLWGYVDETGRAHMASEKVDSRYQLFYKGTTRVGAPPANKPESLPAAAKAVPRYRSGKCRGSEGCGRFPQFGQVHSHIEPTERQALRADHREGGKGA